MQGSSAFHAAPLSTTSERVRFHSAFNCFFIPSATDMIGRVASSHPTNQPEFWNPRLCSRVAGPFRIATPSHSDPLPSRTQLRPHFHLNLLHSFFRRSRAVGDSCVVRSNASNQRIGSRGAPGAYAAGVTRVTDTLDCRVPPLPPRPSPLRVRHSSCIHCLFFIRRT